MRVGAGERWALVALSLFFLVVCPLVLLGAGRVDLSAEQVEHRKKFGAVYMTLNNPFYEIVDEEIRAVVEAHGDVLLSRDPALSAERQEEIVKDFVKDGVKAIFLNPVDWREAGAMLAAAEAAHIPVIVVDTDVAEDAGVVATRIESDNYAAGASCAAHLLSHASGANIAILTHEGAHSAVRRIQGFREALAGQGAYRIVDTAECYGQLERAMPAMEEMLARHPEIDTVMALNDPAALGALAALAAAGRSDVRVYGVDGTPEARERIAAGRMTATAAQSPREIGRRAADAAYQILAGESVEPHVLLQTRLLSRETLANDTEMGWQ